MAIKNGDLADADEVINNCVGLPFKNQAQLLYNAARIGFNSKLNVATGIPNLTNVIYDCCLTDTASTKTQFTYDSGNKSYYASGTDATLIFQTTSLPTVTNAILTSNYLLDQTYSTYTTHCDYTAASRPADWVITGEAYATVTWDAANDEDDIVTATSGQFNAKRASIVYNTDMSYGIVKVALRNITATTNLGSDIFTLTLSFGANYIRLYKIHGGNIKIQDSAGTNYDTGSASIPAQIWFKIHKTKNGRAVFYYSTTGDSNYTTTADVIDGADLTPSKPTISCSIGTPDQSSTCSATASSFNFSIYSTESETSTIATYLSADGTNYEEVTDSALHRFTNTGTNLFVKFEIDRPDVIAVDKISEYGIFYNAGVI